MRLAQILRKTEVGLRMFLTEPNLVLNSDPQDPFSGRDSSKIHLNKLLSVFSNRLEVNVTLRKSISI